MMPQRKTQDRIDGVMIVIAILVFVALGAVSLAQAQAPPNIPLADEVTREHDGAIRRTFTWQIDVTTASKDLMPDAATTGLSQADMSLARWFEVEHCDTVDTTTPVFLRVGDASQGDAVTATTGQPLRSLSQARLYSLRELVGTSTYGSWKPVLLAIAGSGTVTLCVTAIQ